MLSFNTKLLLFLLLLSGNVLIDQVAKWLVSVHLDPNMIYTYYFDWLRLIYVENPGIAYSIGAEWDPSIRFMVFTVFASLLLATFIFYSILSLSYQSLSKIMGFGFIIAGGIGNLIDRIFRDGIVIDYFNIHFSAFRGAIFNYADICISIGLILILITSLTEWLFPYRQPVLSAPIQSESES